MFISLQLMSTKRCFISNYLLYKQNGQLTKYQFLILSSIPCDLEMKLHIAYFSFAIPSFILFNAMEIGGAYA